MIIKLSEKRLAFVDTETTGLDPRTSEIIEFAVVFLDGESHHFKVKPEMPKKTMSPEALKINGYNEEEWTDAITQKQAAEKISKILKNCILVAHNTSFETRFIFDLLNKFDCPQIDYHKIDTITLAYEHLVSIGLTSLSLKNVCKFIGIEPERDLHRALSGAEKCCHVYKKLIKANWFDKLWWWLKNK